MIFLMLTGDCHNQSADWFRNDVRLGKLFDKQEFDKTMGGSL